MASSDKNWPSMFRSKPYGNRHDHHNHQWQHHGIDTPSIMHSPTCLSSPPFNTERAPSPKPRWNPKPEQIQILESIFNSGMINPSRDEIKNIRIRLQQFGQLGDANVFYWFQNRKSRTKHKLRLLQQDLETSGAAHNEPRNNSKNVRSALRGGASSSFGTSYQKPGLFPVQDKASLVSEPAGFLLPVNDYPSATQVGFGPFGYSDLPLSNVVGQTVTEDLHRFENNTDEVEMGFSDVSNGVNLKVEEHVTIPEQEVSFSGIVPDVVSSLDTALIIDQIQECGEFPAKWTVFINDMPFEVAEGLFNVREAFGNDAVLIDSLGHPILTDEWGFTLHPLQNGAVYYLI